jgi:hypothetical protein
MTFSSFKLGTGFCILQGASSSQGVEAGAVLGSLIQGQGEMLTRKSA